MLDEPLSALDAKVRVSLREEIRSIQQKLGITTIFVTHDQEEALSISDRIAVMYGGKAEQVGTPFEIYNRPATKFVANFVGTLNVLEGTVTDAGAGSVRVNSQNLSLKGKLNGSRNGDQLSLALRPEAIALGPKAGHDANLQGQIAEVHFLGSVIRVRVGLGSSVVSLGHLQQFQHAAARGRRQDRDQFLVQRRARAALISSLRNQGSDAACAASRACAECRDGQS